MLATHPDVHGKVNRARAAATDEMSACAQTWIVRKMLDACATACRLCEAACQDALRSL
jgi:hypothetical protein